MPSTRRIGASDLQVVPLSLGGNVFGWTADKDASFAVLDSFRAGGGNFLDTADGYSAWVPGNSGGESESIIGEWVTSRGARDDLVIATKVSTHPSFSGLSAANISAAADASLARLKTDAIDVYFAHFDDASVPLEETVGALSALVDAGKVRAIGISNYSPERIDEWFAVTEQNHFHTAVALQPKYSLVERGFEGALRERAERFDLGVTPYYALASGFLTGKYRDGSVVDSPRAGGAGQYLDERGRAVLSALDDVASAHASSVAAVALAWLRQQPTVVAPIASARSIDQLPDLLASLAIELDEQELSALGAASSD